MNKSSSKIPNKQRNQNVVTDLQTKPIQRNPVHMALSGYRVVSSFLPSRTMGKLFIEIQIYRETLQTGGIE